MLTQKQNRFVDAYVVSGNGTKSAILAGYSARTARSIACENLQKPEILAAVERHEAVRRKKGEATTQRVLEELRNIAFSKIGELFPADAVQDLKLDSDGTVRRTSRKNRSGKRDVRLTKLTMKDKLRALDLLGQHLGLFPQKQRRSKR